MLWPNNSVKGFAQNGCMVACHIGEGKPYGNSCTGDAGEMLEHVAHEGQPRRSATSTTSTATTRATTRRRTPTRAARATRRTEYGFPLVVTASPSS